MLHESSIFVIFDNFPVVDQNIRKFRACRFLINLNMPAPDYTHQAKIKNKIFIQHCRGIFRNLLQVINMGIRMRHLHRCGVFIVNLEHITFFCVVF